jgi:hypothetical protein
VIILKEQGIMINIKGFLLLVSIDVPDDKTVFGLCLLHTETHNVIVTHSPHSFDECVFFSFTDVNPHLHKLLCFNTKVPTVGHAPEEDVLVVHAYSV